MILYADDSVLLFADKNLEYLKKSAFFGCGFVWSKKSSPQFDVAMGSFDGAEVCELVGLYMLYHLSSVIGDKMNIDL